MLAKGKQRVHVIWLLMWDSNHSSTELDHLSSRGQQDGWLEVSVNLFKLCSAQQLGAEVICACESQKHSKCQTSQTDVQQGEIILLRYFTAT